MKKIKKKYYFQSPDMTTLNVVLPFALGVKNALEKELGSTDCWDNGSWHIILTASLCRNHHIWMSLPISDGQKLALEMFFHKANNDINEMMLINSYDDLSDRLKNACIAGCVAMMIEDATAFSC